MLGNAAVLRGKDKSDELATRRLFSVDEFHRMAEAGIFQEDDRLELLGGDIIAMSLVGVRHMACVNRLTDLLTDRFRGKAIISVQNPIRLDYQTEPVPDIALLKYRDDYYAQQATTAADVLLLIEASDSTLGFDRQVERPLYASTSIPEYWLINLTDNQLELYRQPDEGDYQEQLVVQGDERVTAVAFPQVEFQLSELMG